MHPIVIDMIDVRAWYYDVRVVEPLTLPHDERADSPAPTLQVPENNVAHVSL
jgi:hypothetical protein